MEHESSSRRLAGALPAQCTPGRPGWRAPVCARTCVPAGVYLSQGARARVQVDLCLRVRASVCLCVSLCVSSLRSVCACPSVPAPFPGSPKERPSWPVAVPPWVRSGPGSPPRPSSTGTYKVSLHQAEPPLAPCFPGNRALWACPRPPHCPSLFLPQLSPSPLCQLLKHPSSGATLAQPPSPRRSPAFSSCPRHRGGSSLSPHCPEPHWGFQQGNWPRVSHPCPLHTRSSVASVQSAVPLS